MTEPRIVDRLRWDPEAERRALVAGLVATPASIPPKYFYDAVGCALYGAICELPEYYPTRTERAIFAEHREAIAGALGRGRQFVDLGAGDCGKALRWLPLVAPARYVAVDFAGDEIGAALAKMAPDFPGVELAGVVTDFTRGLDLDADLTAGPATFFYPGSSIGILTPAEALAFLRDIRRHCAARPGSLLIGVDTKKDKARLDDAVPRRGGRDGRVQPQRARPREPELPRAATSGRRRSRTAASTTRTRAASRCTSRRLRRSASACPARRTFAAGERIHTENSYKYAPTEFAAMLATAGFADVRCWQDAHGDFAVFHTA